MDTSTTVSLQNFIAIRDKIMHKIQHCWVKGDNETFIIIEGIRTQPALLATYRWCPF